MRFRSNRDRLYHHIQGNTRDSVYQNMHCSSRRCRRTSCLAWSPSARLGENTVGFAPLAPSVFCAARQNAVLHRSLLRPTTSNSLETATLSPNPAPAWGAPAVSLATWDHEAPPSVVRKRYTAPAVPFFSGHPTATKSPASAATFAPSRDASFTQRRDGRVRIGVGHFDVVKSHSTTCCRRGRRAKSWSIQSVMDFNSKTARRAVKN